MSTHPLAGRKAPRNILPDIPALVAAYYEHIPDAADAHQRISFGTSGHRGSSLKQTFNQNHILAICQAICEYRRVQGYTGPLFLGRDTHALSQPATMTALEVFAANSVETVIQADNGYTPTPVISHAILTHNRNRTSGLADGVVVTPSHNPPEDGGFKYNPPNGGPADTDTTRWIADRANEHLANKLMGIKRLPYARALASHHVHAYDFVMPYVRDLATILDMEAIQRARLKIGVDPMGGSGIGFWEPIAEEYGLDIDVVNKNVDPTFSFMRVDRDGKIRMDCSSPYAMAGLIELKDRFDIAFGNDPDYDRHGIVTRQAGLIKPNDYLAAAISYLFSTRTGWNSHLAMGKTMVTTSMIDRVAGAMGRNVVEVPVGFKWFVPHLLEGTCGFGGEESAGASFLRKDGTVWTTDKDGIIMDLLAAEMTAVTGKDPATLYKELEDRFGTPVYQRIQAPASHEQKKALKQLSPDMVKATTLAGEPILAKQTRAAGNDAPFGGLKVVAPNGWFAARPSGTEEIYKIYAESFKGENHLQEILDQAQEMVNKALA
ncbi:phosphoglucomutase (alpha-D-glucose-1,6-bisphosphate-dependent) [Desulfoplanes formicivorans]|uniref:Phosphoglucomutase n=1 Tax=Desulfoplanes formicivorans TaxID=1592317 RepID=A0A194AFW8_9BACT|nr:phosphoglucomutase (alpha-D-glucose-1,6-bisphosphate-dependent) [Desulfoplanes formicivorans]GAU08977.1 phosphoglucomutase [Desulfoplanes formicivorans]